MAGERYRSPATPPDPREPPHDLPDRPTLGVGLIGYAFMGAAHSQAWRTAPHFFDLPLRPELTVLAGRNAGRRRRRRRAAGLVVAPRPTGAA